MDQFKLPDIWQRPPAPRKSIAAPSVPRYATKLPALPGAQGTMASIPSASSPVPTTAVAATTATPTQLYVPGFMPPMPPSMYPPAMGAGPALMYHPATQPYYYPPGPPPPPPPAGPGSPPGAASVAPSRLDTTPKALTSMTLTSPRKGRRGPAVATITTTALNSSSNGDDKQQMLQDLQRLDHEIQRMQ
jgi:hypothetical protein